MATLPSLDWLRTLFRSLCFLSLSLLSLSLLSLSFFSFLSFWLFRLDGLCFGFFLFLDWFNGDSFNTMRSIFLDEFDEVLYAAITVILNRFALLASWEKLDGRESLNLFGNVVLGCITLGNNNLVIVFSICSAKFFVFWRKIFAVATLN
jgi:hypothetical protein